MEARAAFCRQEPKMTPQPDRVIINMSLEEARTLKQLFMSTGGDPESSPRKHTDAINHSLARLGVHCTDHKGKFDIWFDDVEPSTL